MMWADTFSELLDSRIPAHENPELRARLSSVLQGAGDLYREFSECKNSRYSHIGIPLECIALAFELHATASVRSDRDAAFDLLIGDGLIALAFKLAADVHDDAFRICTELSLSLIGDPHPRRAIRNHLNGICAGHADSKTSNPTHTNNHGGSE
jgi:hypothetical protein